MFTSIWRDLVYAGRSLAKTPAFTFVCVVSLGIGMAYGQSQFKKESLRAMFVLTNYFQTIGRA